MQSDGIILESPIYLSDVTGNMRCLLEGFMFPFVAYSKTETVEHKKMPLSYICTMKRQMRFHIKLDIMTTLK
ncbi:hypothetical protein [Methanobrevibacter sp.]|uniref:hypothetical protein n=1 Tax=Methanobrevibacter sp. TaxID=66852 RepID=UPI003890ADB2